MLYLEDCLPGDDVVRSLGDYFVPAIIGNQADFEAGAAAPSFNSDQIYLELYNSRSTRVPQNHMVACMHCSTNRLIGCNVPNSW